ncbi:hypothetical protein M9H77_30380 [Catharanthus roseus]|uniref:Uncharacterized protein n=1 Tax=Catharanthus roseus TaxID=4058 RepID=A0ACB9ZZD4_CATRO|nr:hypothetical protein M9H77_30380 [Catharanthus roseus]
MWSNLPFDVLAEIYSVLAPDSFACAKSACRKWHESAKYLTPTDARHKNPPWFIALPSRDRGLFCYAYKPIDKIWDMLPLDFIPKQFLPISAIDGLILLRLTSSTSLKLAICNPFTRQFKVLRGLNVTRTHPAVGVELKSKSDFKIHVAGGMSDGPRGGASYEPTVEMYDSICDKWEIIGSVPIEFAVRLTVWTPNESVCSNGVLYWMTSARAYSVMGFEMGTNYWKELSVPMADRLEFAALVPRNGKLTLIGGKCGGNACIWELGDADRWFMIEMVEFYLGMRFLGGKGCWSSTKCVGSNGNDSLERNSREEGQMGMVLD